MRGLFITGTDTGVGKTLLAAAIVARLCEQGMRTGALKPVATGVPGGTAALSSSAGRSAGGADEDNDIDRLRRALGGDVPREWVCPLVFEEPLAPPVAARRAGTRIEMDDLLAAARAWQDRCDVLVVEGVGGLLCPLTERETVADLAVRLGFPLVIVARLGLGTLNHTLLTLEAARARQLRVAGIILNAGPYPPEAPHRNPMPPCGAAPGRGGRQPAIAERTNPAELARRTDAAILAVLPSLPADARVDPVHLLLRDPDFRAVDWLALCALTHRT